MTAYAFGKGFAGAFGKGMQDSPFAPDNQFDDGISIDEALERSGLNFEIKETPALYMVNGLLHASREKTLYRGDNGDFLSNMGTQFKVVQPAELLETHRTFLDAGGYHIRAAGIFKNGARFWSMAEAHGELELAGGDRLKSYMMMGSAVDGSSASWALGTAQRMSCWNQAPVILKNAKANGKFIRVPHSATFDVNDARVQLASADDQFKLWCEDARMLSEQRIKNEDVLTYFADVFDVQDEDAIERLEKAAENKRIQLCIELFNGAGMGSELKSAKGTAWGAYNAITEYVDHHAAADNAVNRFANATTGNGARIKARAWDFAVGFANDHQ